MSQPAVLTIAGSDSGAGAGIQADLKTFSALGGYGMAVVTALTAQNTRGVKAIHVPPASFVADQIDAIFEDIRVDVVKIGMLATAQIADVVADRLRHHCPQMIVLDPVMVATSGHPLLAADADAGSPLPLAPPVAHVFRPLVSHRSPEGWRVSGSSRATWWGHHAELEHGGEAGGRVLAAGGETRGPRARGTAAELACGLAAI